MWERLQGDIEGFPFLPHGLGKEKRRSYGRGLGAARHDDKRGDKATLANLRDDGNSPVEGKLATTSEALLIVELVASNPDR